MVQGHSKLCGRGDWEGPCCKYGVMVQLLHVQSLGSAVQLGFMNNFYGKHLYLGCLDHHDALACMVRAPD